MKQIHATVLPKSGQTNSYGIVISYKQLNSFARTTRSNSITTRQYRRSENSLFITSYSIPILDQSWLVVKLLDTQVKQISRNTILVTPIFDMYSRYNAVSMDYFTLMVLAGYTLWVYPTCNILKKYAIYCNACQSKCVTIWSQ